MNLTQYIRQLSPCRYSHAAAESFVIELTIPFQTVNMKDTKKTADAAEGDSGRDLEVLTVSRFSVTDDGQEGERQAVDQDRDAKQQKEGAFLRLVPQHPLRHAGSGPAA